MPLASVPEASESGGHGQDILGDEANPLTGDARTDPLLARLAAGDEVSHGAIAASGGTRFRKPLTPHPPDVPGLHACATKVHPARG